MEQIVLNLSSWVWAPLAYIILALGAVFTIATVGVQFRRFPDMIRLVIRGTAGAGGLSSFQAMALTLSARVGVGAIAGVAVAISMGGPGALMWMVITALVASMVAYAEAVLAQVYKQVIGGEHRGGLAYYLKYGLGVGWFAAIVATVSVIGYGFIFPAIQVNNIASSAELAFGVPPWVTGLFVTGILFLVIVGGTKRIVSMAQAVVPVMSILFLLGALVILIANVTEVPSAIALIVRSGLGIEPLYAGIVGYAVQWGVRRAVFASAAGDGEGTFAAAAAKVSHPAKQGLVQAFSIFLAVLVICMATGIMIVVTGTYNVADGAGGYLVEPYPGMVAGATYAQEAINTVLPGIGPGFIAIAILFFAFTSQVFYFYVAQTNMVFLFDSPKFQQVMNVVLRIGAMGISFFGAVASAEVVWAAGDLGFGLLTWCNMICLVVLSPVVIKVCRDYDRQRRAGVNPVFDPEALNIKRATFWEDEKRQRERETAGALSTTP